MPATFGLCRTGFVTPSETFDAAIIQNVKVGVANPDPHRDTLVPTRRVPYTPDAGRDTRRSELRAISAKGARKSNYSTLTFIPSTGT